VDRYGGVLVNDEDQSSPIRQEVPDGEPWPSFFSADSPALGSSPIINGGSPRLGSRQGNSRGSCRLASISGVIKSEELQDSQKTDNKALDEEREYANLEQDLLR